MHHCITAQSHMHHCITAQSHMHHCIAAQSHIASEEKTKHPNYYVCSRHWRASLTNVGRITAPSYNLLSYHTYCAHVNYAIHKNFEGVSEQNNKTIRPFVFKKPPYVAPNRFINVEDEILYS